MNHSGDANKMVSDTPRTDAEYERLFEIYQNAERINGPLCCAFENDMRLCRQLERELNAANSRIELLMSANSDVARIAGERDAAEKRVKRLEAVVNDPHALWANWLRGDVKLPAGIGDVRQYQARIKRLEEAGQRVDDAAHSIQDWSGTVLGDALDELNKAKEDKP